MPRLSKVLAAVLFVYLVILGGWHFFSSVKQTRRKIISDHNQLQMILARQAATNVQTYLGLLGEDLRSLAHGPDIINLSARGRQRLHHFHQARTAYVSGITRINSQGRIQHTEPPRPEVIGKSVLQQPHNAKLFHTRKPVLSKVLRILQGYRAIVYAYPVFEGNTFKGAISLLISLDHITARFFRPVIGSRHRRALVIAADGTVVFYPRSDLAGQPLPKQTSSSFQRLLAHMKQGKTGSYSFEPPKYLVVGESKARVQGAYTTIELPGTTWSIVVWTPEAKVLAEANQQRTRWLWFLTLFGLGLLAMAYLVIYAFVIVAVQKKKRKTERALVKSEHRFHAVLENLPVGLTVANTDETISFLNKRMLALCDGGCRPGTSLKDLMGVLAPEQQSRQWEENLHQFCSRKAILKASPTTFETEIRTPPGQPRRFVSVTQKPMKEHLIVAFEDITQRRQSEQIEQELQAQTDRAKKMETVGLMAGGVAHDLNNLLSGVVSYPDALLLEIDEDDPLHEPLMDIRDSGYRASAVVSDLLTTTRGIASQKSDEDIVSIVREHLSSLEHEELEGSHPQVQVTVDLPSEPLLVCCSRIHIIKSVMNLLSNAFEAFGEDPGEVTISLQERHLDEPRLGYEAILPGTWVVITVTDTAAGISAEDQERIFEPFYTKKMMGRSGTGLGLAIVWNTMRDHHGFIDLQSDISGTAFSLYFPRARGDAASTVETEDLPVLDGAGQRVLVVDDEPQQRKIAEKLLRSWSFEVVTAASGEEAVQHVQSQPVDLMLIDMMMEPGIDGLETYMRVLQRYPEQAAIITSGYAQNDRVTRAFSLGASGYLQKPWTVTELNAAITKALSR